MTKVTKIQILKIKLEEMLKAAVVANDAAIIAEAAIDEIVRDIEDDAITFSAADLVDTAVCTPSGFIFKIENAVDGVQNMEDKLLKKNNKND